MFKLTRSIFKCRFPLNSRFESSLYSSCSFQLTSEPSKREYTSSPNQNPLTNYFKAKIKMKGPLTVNEYMKEALGHPQWVNDFFDTFRISFCALRHHKTRPLVFQGYYKKKDVFGAQGDFTTSPEVSQMFGEVTSFL